MNYIAYVQQNIPGLTLFEVQAVGSVVEARELVEKADKTFMVECSGSIYPYTDENWALALEYAEIGCPFDYPDFVVTRNEHGDYYAERA